MPIPSTRTTRQRFAQYSLRTLFLFVTCLAVVTGFSAKHFRRTWRQQEAVKRLESVDARVLYENEYHYEDYATVFGPQPIDRDDLDLIVGRDFWYKSQPIARDDSDPIFGRDFWYKVTSVEFSRYSLEREEGEWRANRVELSDSIMACLEDLPGLERLDLSKSTITDDGLKHLAGLKSLKYLALNGTSISDEGVSHLSQLVALEELSLQKTNISDAGIEHISRLTSLRSLSVSETRATWRGMQQLQGLPNLEYLGFDDSQIPKGALDRFSDMFPNIGFSCLMLESQVDTMDADASALPPSGDRR